MRTYKLTRNEAILLVDLLGAEADRLPFLDGYFKRMGSPSDRRRNKRRMARVAELRERLWKETVLSPNR